MPIPTSTGVVSYADLIKLSIIDKSSTGKNELLEV
jgi:hypothetical protein